VPLLTWTERPSPTTKLAPDDESRALFVVFRRLTVGALARTKKLVLASSVLLT
jgi:hypothetical protein